MSPEPLAFSASRARSSAVRLLSRSRPAARTLQTSRRCGGRWEFRTAGEGFILSTTRRCEDPSLSATAALDVWRQSPPRIGKFLLDRAGVGILTALCKPRFHPPDKFGQRGRRPIQDCRHQHFRPERVPVISGKCTSGMHERLCGCLDGGFDDGDRQRCKRMQIFKTLHLRMSYDEIAAEHLVCRKRLSPFVHLDVTSRFCCERGDFDRSFSQDPPCVGWSKVNWSTHGNSAMRRSDTP